METLRVHRVIGNKKSSHWKSNLLFCCILTMLGSLSLHGQKKWTFEQCVEHALTYNIQLNQSRLQSDLAENQYKQSKVNIAPDLSAGVSGSLGFGMSQNRYGVYSNSNSGSANASVGANWNVFQGGRNAQEIKRQKYSFWAAMQEDDKIANDIRLNIAARFLTVLLQKELLKIAQNQYALSEEIERKTLQLVERGRESNAKLSEIKAQKASDHYNQTLAERDVVLALWDLAHLLRLDSLQNFDIEAPILAEPDTVLLLSMQQALSEMENLPQVQAEKYRLEAAQKGLSAARTSFSPSLSFSASVSTAYYYQFAPTEMVNENFSTQMKNNFRGYTGLSLNIPIFSKMNAIYGLRNAKIEVNRQSLQLEEVKFQLSQEIRKAMLNVITAQKRHESASEWVKANQEAYRYTEEKYFAEKLTSYDLQQAKYNLEKSLSEWTQAKFEYIFNLKILGFYKGEEIRF